MKKTILLEKFISAFNTIERPIYVRCGGRFEILGNHTDHNHGLCIAATCDMSTYAICDKNNSDYIHIVSEGYLNINIDINNIDINISEQGSSISIVKGICRYLKEHNYHIGGFNAYIISEIFPGAGVSSSASFELLIGYIINVLFNNKNIDKLTLAKVGQYAENVYYGKNSGLLDQIGVSYGGMVSIDFKDMNDIKINSLHMNLDGYSFILINTGGDHSKMSDLYSQIPLDMKKASNILGVNYLRESNLDKLELFKDKMDKRIYLRALHFYKENMRVEAAISAIKDNNIPLLIKYMNESRNSSNLYLNNMMYKTYDGSPLEACELIDKLTNNEGACKINGGGFAGSVVSLIPNKYKDKVIEEMKNRYGNNNIYLVNIDDKGVSEF